VLEGCLIVWQEKPEKKPVERVSFSAIMQAGRWEDYCMGRLTRQDAEAIAREYE